MWIDLKEIRESRQPRYIRREFTDEDLKFDPEVGCLDEPARVDFKVSLSGDLARVTGHLSAGLQLVCCRCLNLYRVVVDKDVDLEYQPDPEVAAEGEEFELEYADLTVGFYRKDRIDLTALIGEQLLLEVPMKPVCREDCKGLCPQCGADRNTEPCECRTESLDPRLSALAGLKERLH